MTLGLKLFPWFKHRAESPNLAGRVRILEKTAGRFNHGLCPIGSTCARIGRCFLKNPRSNQRTSKSTTNQSWASNE